MRKAVTLTAALGGRTRTTELRVEPSRKWTVYIAPASHTDIGYTDIQEKTLEGHNQDTDKAIELAKAYPGLSLEPGGCRSRRKAISPTAPANGTTS